MERRLMIAVDRDLLEVRVPDAARVPAESNPSPIRRCQVHCTSLAVNGLPSCHLTPWRSLKVSLVRLASHAQLSARSGTMVSMLLRGLRLIEQHEVVEDRHEGRHRRNRHLLMDRCARRVRADEEAQRAAGFLRRGGAAGQHRRNGKQDCCGDRTPTHEPLPCPSPASCRRLAIAMPLRLMEPTAWPSRAMGIGAPSSRRSEGAAGRQGAAPACRARDASNTRQPGWSRSRPRFPRSRPPNPNPSD